MDTGLIARIHNLPEYVPDPGCYFAVLANISALDDIVDSELKELMKQRLLENGNILYVGSANDVKARSFNHLRGNISNSTMRKSLSLMLNMTDEPQLDQWIHNNIQLRYDDTTCKSKRDATEKEKNYIQQLEPPLNLTLKSKIKDIISVLRKESEEEKKTKNAAE